MPDSAVRPHDTNRQASEAGTEGYADLGRVAPRSKDECLKHYEAMLAELLQEATDVDA
jgi:hypothetical protein